MISTENRNALEVAVSKIVAKAWIDDEFRTRFINEPTAILREAGLVIGDFVKVIVNQGAAATPALKVTDGGAMIYEINLPPKPADLSDELISSWGAGILNVAIPGCC